MEVAQIAWDALAPAVRARAAELLRLNPQYVAWTVNIAAEKRDQIAFVRAATWPDFIRGAHAYTSDGPDNGNRPPPRPEASQNIGYSDHFMHKYWHFIDEPFSTDGSPLQPPPSPNAQTQIALFRKALASPLTSDDVKSYDLAWLLHLVGDVHQPLHATARFTSGQPNGDAGGNLVMIDCAGCQETNLHRFWDDTPGVGDNADDAIAAARTLPAADPRQAAVRDEKVWIDESFEIAKSVVYQTPIGAGAGPFTLTDGYKTTAALTARQRVALAGARVALLLNTALSPPVDPRLGCGTVSGAPAPDLTQPENIDFVKMRLLYYRCTVYEDEVAKVLAAAQRWTASRATQVARPAIVLDIDETSLSNWPRIFQDDFAYIPNGTCGFKLGDPCGDLDWQQSGSAIAVAPTLEFYRVARCIDQGAPCTPIDVFFITGRRQIEHNYEMASVWTLRNLNNAGYGAVSPDHLYMRDPNSVGTVADYKSSARADIESKGFTIITNIGDQYSDLAKGHAEMTFKVPNPFYFIP
jgi:acid phosphatase